MKFNPVLNPTSTGWFRVKIPVQAAGLNILKFAIFVPILVGLVEEEYPYKFSIMEKKINLKKSSC